MSRRAGRLLGVILVVLALIGGVALVLTSGSDDAPSTSATTLPPPPPPGGSLPSAPALDGPLPVSESLDLVPVAEVPGGTALRVVGDEVRVTDATTGARTTVDAVSGDASGPVTFGSLSRRDRAVPDPDGGGWSAEATELHRLDDEGEIVDTIVLEVPGAVDSVDDEAVWLTVRGVPGSHTEGPAGVQSYLQRVDRATGEVVVRALDDPAGAQFAIEPDGVWVTVGRTIYRLDPVTLEPIAEGELAEPAAALVAYGDEVLVVVGGDAPSLVRLGAADLAPRSTLDLGSEPVGDAALVPAAAIAMPEADVSAVPELWILRPESGAVSRVDLLAEGSVVDDVEVPAPRRIEVDDAGRAWILSGAADGTLLRLSPTTG